MQYQGLSSVQVLISSCARSLTCGPSETVSVSLHLICKIMYACKCKCTHALHKSQVVHTQPSWGGGGGGGCTGEGRVVVADHAGKVGRPVLV